MKAAHVPLKSLLAAYLVGLVFFLLQQFLLLRVLGFINHPLALLGSAPDPLRALALWNLAERLLCVLLAGWPTTWLLRRLSATPQAGLVITFSAAMVAGTLAGLTGYYSAPGLFPLWVRLLDIGLVIIALPLLNSHFLWVRN
ncbi:MAG TPA: hypothetical protein VFP95_07485 [Gammaproteobacteria bacterium]|nr:hypothetical protein [Gammaproteobacteria bacterium]